MVVGGQYDGGDVPSDLSVSLFQMFCQSQVFYSETMCFDFIVKQCVLFNNPQHFYVSLSLSKALSGKLLLLVLKYYFFYFFLKNIKTVGMLKDMRKREMHDVSLGN